VIFTVVVTVVVTVSVTVIVIATVTVTVTVTITVTVIVTVIVTKTVKVNLSYITLTVDRIFNALNVPLEIDRIQVEPIKGRFEPAKVEILDQIYF
jgi:hypothetical protein